jgi:adenine-specific DNA-methyltransferase
MPARKTKSGGIAVEKLTHEEATRKNIPTAEYESMVEREQAAAVQVRYPRGMSGCETEKAERNRDLDPQLVWRDDAEGRDRPRGMGDVEQ